MSETSRIPVFVVTGFLGSGKTTLVNSLLKQPRLSNTAIVVNEFGEIGLDHLLVTSARDNIVLLDAGCLCCTVLGSLKETMADLYRQRALGHTPMFQRVIIETSGLADPGPILQMVMRDSIVANVFRMAGLICVADALFGLDTIDNYGEARAQVAIADKIFVSKTDRTEGACPNELFTLLKAINPTVEILTMNDIETYAGLFDERNEATSVKPWLGEFFPALPDEQKSATQHTSSVTAECFWIEHPATWSGLAAWIDTTRRRYGRDILRCKGLVAVSGSPGPVIVHGVQSLFDTMRMPTWPDPDQRSRMVIIGKNIDREALALSFNWLSAPEGTQPPFDPLTAPPVLNAT